MMKVLLVFVILLAAYAVGINVFRSMTNKERLSTFKTIGYASLCAVLSAFTLTIIVYTF